MIFTLIGGIIFFSFVLIKAADLVIIAIRRISKNINASAFVVSAMILAIGTSFPELFVGISSAIEKSPNLTFGVVMGSNIANIALVGSIAAIVSGRVHVWGEYLKHDVWFAFVAGFLPIFLVLDGNLGRVDGLILVTMYFAYATGFFRKRYTQIGMEQEQEENFFYRFLRKVNKIEKEDGKEFARLFVGVALLLFSSDVIVKLSTILAQQAKLPLFVVGLFVIAIGTSLPELAFSLRSLEDHEPQMFFGNLLGSIIANSTMIIGITALIYPIKILAFSQYSLSVVFFVLTFLLFWIFIKSEHRLDRWEAGVLFVIYLIFAMFEFAQFPHINF